MCWHNFKNKALRGREPRSTKGHCAHYLSNCGKCVEICSKTKRTQKNITEKKTKKSLKLLSLCYLQNVCAVYRLTLFTRSRSKSRQRSVTQTSTLACNIFFLISLV